MLQCNLDYRTPFVHGLIAAIPDKWNVQIQKCLHFSPSLWYLAYKQYLYSMIMASSVQKSSLVSQFWPRQVCRVRSSSLKSVTTPTKDHWPRLLHMRGDVFSGIQLVRIIEGLDKRGLDNRGCTVIIQWRSELWNHKLFYSVNHTTIAKSSGAHGSYTNTCTCTSIGLEQLTGSTLW